MARPRKYDICLEVTTYYHCVSRCVRRAFLCGHDDYTGESYEHRRQWVEDRLLSLTRSFTIDICAYAVMSNHCHVVLHVDVEKADALTTAEIVERWHGLFAGNILSQRFLAGILMSDAEIRAVEEQAETWRKHLMSVSWFMRCLNEHIARRANQEDDCTGRFWEGRFKCQALLDESALLACMAYVDLNPVRAGIANSPEESEYTSIHRRMAKFDSDPNTPELTHLMPFRCKKKHLEVKCLHFNLRDYLDLLDWTGRAIRDESHGAIQIELPPIARRQQIDQDAWLSMTEGFESLFHALVGPEEAVLDACAQTGRNWSRGINACRRCFPT
jgi:REP element-mobilizing transposase RayT